MTAARRILLVRLSAIGDIVFASSLVAAFREADPTAHIAWMVQPECRSLLEHHPDLDEVIVWPYRQWRDLWGAHRWSDLWREIGRFRRLLRERRFDLAVDLQGLLKSGLLTWLSGAPERIGLGSREGSQWLMTRVIPRGGDTERIGSEYLFLAERLGLPVADFGMEVHYGAQDAAYADALVTRDIAGGRYAVICPFTTRPQKHWFEPRWAELTSRLRDELGLVTVMLGGPADREAASRIQEQAGSELLNLAGDTSLLQAAALVERAELLVGVDTGLSHTGIAYGRPSLLLFGSTCPYLNTTRANARVLYRSMPCSPCRRNPTCNGDFTCMKSIEVNEVVAAARDLIGRAP
ncbi:MAG: glycosyltransferase family 9 protein [Chromatiaceae bacterium]